ncbi:hypothetical protein E2C01_058867 [Portunus trituberculatus]|uniref:Uncharacterized protein n=1 Tax=Portunus trituberculatus TaxID=210409 RepID=A0A5B7H5W1_PORTR|nr:hypothetical protein [Portunus trituberculatus]
MASSCVRFARIVPSPVKCQHHLAFSCRTSGVHYPVWPCSAAPF